MTIRVLLADDQALIRGGFAALVGSAADMEVVAEAPDGEAALALARETRPDVVLMDVRLPGTDGISATQAITADPELGEVHVLVLTTFEDDDLVLAALRAGAAGFLGKGVEPAELLDAIRVVAHGEALLSPRATKGLISRLLAQPTDGPPELVGHELAALTDREREVVALVARGLTNDEIAARLFVSPLTAKTHVNRAMTKVGARDRAQLVVVAYTSGLVRPGDADA
jgi:DNA-binding NarL/FixJ family response regulator